MADVLTTNLSLVKVEVGASEDTWGEKLNDNADVIDGLFTAGPALSVASGGTGAVDAAAARTNLGLGTIATQAADNVALTGGLIDGVTSVRITSTAPQFLMGESDAAVGSKNWGWIANAGQLSLRLYDDAWSGNSQALILTRSGNSPLAFNFTGPLQVNGATVWHASNDGADSGADADLLDGQHGSYYRNASNMLSGTLPQAQLPSNVLRNSGAFTGGAVTISASAPSGTPAPGDIWLQYV